MTNLQKKKKKTVLQHTEQQQRAKKFSTCISMIDTLKKNVFKKLKGHMPYHKAAYSIQQHTSPKDW